jgi:segregation and condensation protein B
MNEMSLESKIEAILFWKGEAVSVSDLAKILGVEKEEISKAISQLSNTLSGRGISLVQNGEEVMLYTSPEHSELIKNLTKEELSRDISKAGVEVLSLIIYRGPITKTEIDYIRGVNSNYVVRNLQIRGLIQRVDSADSRSFMYQPTLELLAHLGISKKEDLADFERVNREIEAFMVSKEDQDDRNGGQAEQTDKSE